MRNKGKEPFNNLFETICNEVDSNNDILSRIIKFSDRTVDKYSANVQNVKRDHFDFLIYVLLYYEGIEIFKIKSDDINKSNISTWCDKHGRYDAIGKSGQFPVKPTTIKDHENKYFNLFLHYDDIVEITKGLQ